MFDTMTLTKLGGGLCGALLIFLLGKWAAELIYHPAAHGGDHAQGYVIDTGADEGGDATVEEGPSFAELFLAADLGKGEKAFNKCKACHKLDEGDNGTGPYLYGVVGRDVASANGFSYSGNLKPVVSVWTPQELDGFLEDPAGYAPGTTMAFSGLKKPEDRANLIAFLDQTDGDTYVIEEAAAPEADASTEQAAVESEQEAAEETETAAEQPAAEEDTTEVAAAEEETATEAEGATETSENEEVAEEPAAEETAEAALDEATEEVAAEEGNSSDVGFAEMVAAANPEEGQKIFRRCAACHTAEEGKNRVGPSLYAVIGRDIASIEGFKYSDALIGLDGDWTVEELDKFLTNPKEYVPGVRMAFPGLKDQADRAGVVAYLMSVVN